MKIRTLADQTATCSGRTDFSVESLDNGNRYGIEGALVVPYFSDEESTLPHAVDTSRSQHFNGKKIPVISNHKRVDILIGQSDKSLLIVLSEREGAPNEPNLVFTRLGPVASGGRVHMCPNSLQALRVQTISADSDCSKCNELQHTLATAKDTLREFQLLDEEVQPSKNDELACQQVEPFIRVVQGRSEMPVPFKANVLKALPNNYNNALKRTLSVRQTAFKNNELKCTLTDTLPEDDIEKQSAWYLPFFVTNPARPRVVYDGAATTKGMSLNQAVLAGENLLNGLLDVLMRFRMGKYACAVDVSRYFLQIKLPRSQQDWFRIIWFEGNDLDGGKIKIYRFTCHVWGVNSSPYVALLAFKRLVEENPTDASPVTRGGSTVWYGTLVRYGTYLYSPKSTLRLYGT